MSSFAYLLPFISVVVGLAVTDLATSLHRLLRARRRVEWDWLPLATATLSVLTVLDVWWGLYGLRKMTSLTFAGFIPLFAYLVVLFLLNAAALPDDVPADGLDLRAFYEANSSYFWFLFATYLLLVTATNVGPRIVSVFSGEVAFRSILGSLIPNLVFAGLCVSLALVRNRIFHAVATVVVIGFLLLQWTQRSIGAV